MVRSLRRLGRAALALCMLGASASTLEAQRTLAVEDWSARIVVNEDGTLDVREAIRYRFDGSWNGVYRDIPVNYENNAGLNYRLELRNISARNDAGNEFEFETSREGHSRRIKVWVPGANDATHTVHFTYRVLNGLRFFDGEGEGFDAGYDELYWNVTGNESEVPIERASARVVLPPAVTGTRVKVFTGAYGARRSETSVIELESEFFFQTTQGLGPGEGLTVDLAWDPGVVRRPTALDRALGAIRSNWIFVLPLLSLIIMWRRWLARGKDPALRPISPQYEPPEGMNPAEVGTLVDNRPDMRDITSSLVDLAVRGYIRIEERTEEKLAGLIKSEEFTFHRVRPREDWEELSDFEATLLQRLFRHGSDRKVDTEELENSFYADVGDLKNSLFDSLLEAGHYRHRPDHVLALYVILSFVVLFVTMFAAIGIAASFGFTPLSAGLTAIGTAVPVLLFGIFMPARTKDGARTLEHILGFQEFLNRVEADHFERMVDSPEMFEKYLPYAMALGVEKRWARAFEDLYTEPPDWYYGSGMMHFSSTRLAANLGAVSTRAGSAMSSQPRSSSGGSGFSSGGGGGFSGGGFGGGGTGGF